MKQPTNFNWTAAFFRLITFVVGFVLLIAGITQHSLIPGVFGIGFMAAAIFIGSDDE